MIAFELNGTAVRSDATPATRLSEVLRGQLGQMGTKSGCDAGDCGACTVLIDGEPACACLVSAAQADGARITTIEGLKALPRGALLQQAFLARGAAQCGICTPGMLVAAVALLDREAKPSRAMIEDALGGVVGRGAHAVFAAGRYRGPDRCPLCLHRLNKSPAGARQREESDIGAAGNGPRSDPARDEAPATLPPSRKATAGG